MAIELNAALNQMYTFAQQAARNAQLSGEDTVIQKTPQGDPALVGHKWVKLGGRSDAFKASNLATRTAFYESLCSLFGGAEKIPAAVRAVLKLGDFKLNDAGEVTSCRPLTARRIISVCNAVKAYNAANAPTNFNPITADDYQNLTPGLKADYEKYVEKRGMELEAAASMDVDKLSVLHYLKGRADALASYAKLFEGDRREEFQVLLRSVRNDIDQGDITPARAACLELLTSWVKGQQALKGLVEERTKDLPVYDQLLVLQQAEQALQDKVVPLVKKIFTQDAVPAGLKDTSFEALMRKYDFKPRKPVPGATAAENAGTTLSTDNAMKFITRYLEAYKDEFMSCPGENTDDYKGKTKNKWENITEALRCFKALKDDVELSRWLDASIQEGEKFPGSPAEAKFLQEVAKKQAEFEVKKAKAQAAGKPFKDHFSMPPKCPASQMPSGRKAEERIKEITKVTGHARSNTPAQVREAYDTFCKIDEYFFKCLDIDRANGDTKMFDMLMDALNTTACLQGRCSRLQTVIMALDTDLAKVKDIAIGKDDKVMAAMGKAIQQLQAKEDEEVDYAEAAKKLADAMTDKDGKPLEMELDFAAGDYKVGDKVPVTVEFLAKPEVADVLKACLPYFKD